MRTRSYYEPLLATACLFLGTLTYLLFRPAIVMFHHPVLQSLQVGTGRGVYQQLFTNYFPDLCWSVFVNLFAWWMWRRSFPRFYFYFLLALPFVSESLQLFSMIPGTFDPADLALYLMTFFIFFIFNIKINAKDQTSHRNISDPCSPGRDHWKRQS